MKGNALVPVGPFRRILESRIVEACQIEDKTPRQVVADRAGLNVRSVYRILSPETNGIEFDNADRIVTHLVGPMGWWDGGELEEIYLAADLKRIDWARPTSKKVAGKFRKEAMKALLEHGSVSEASRVLGVGKQAMTEILGPDGVHAARKRYVRVSTHCRRGHDISVYGRDSGGYCRACRVLSRRSRHENVSGKTRRKRVEV